MKFIVSMSIPKVIIAFYSTLFCMACNVPEVDQILETKDVITLNTEWRFSRWWGGVFKDLDSGEEFIYTGDPITFKIIRVFNGHGKSLYDVPLGPALDSLGSIKSFTFVGRNRIFLLRDAGSAYAIIDSSGSVVSFHDLKSELCDRLGDKYDLFADLNGLALLHGDIFVGAMWNGPCVETEIEDFNPKNYYQEATPKCRAARIHLSDSAPLVTIGASNILKNLTDIPRCTAGMTGLIGIEDQLLLINPYSSDIMELNTTTLEVIRRHPIRYVNGPIGITPPPASMEDELADGSNLRFATKPFIYCFGYDTPSQHYFATVPHEVPEPSADEEPRKERDWSLLILDSAFTKLTEHVLTSTSYNSSGILSLKSGTWVLFNNEGMKGNSEPKVFHRLNIK